MQIKTGWKEEMDELMKRTRKNWENTGKAKKASGVTGSICLSNERKTISKRKRGQGD